MILESLKKLENQNAVEVVYYEEGPPQWVAKSEYSILEDDFKNELLAEFHRQSFLKAIESQGLEKGQRRFDALILALGPEEYAQFNEDLQQFLDMQFYKYNTSKLKSRTLFQVQIGSFPAI